MPHGQHGLDKDGDPLVETEPFINHESEASVSYNTRDLLLYAVSIGCAKESRTGNDSNHADLRFIYEQDTRFAAFPTFPITLAMKGDTQDIDAVASSDTYLGKNRPKSDPSKPKQKSLNVKGVITGVDAERYIERVKDIPAFGHTQMKIKSRTIGIHKKGNNMLTEGESELVGEDGTVFYKFQNGGISIGAYGFKDSGRSNSEKIVAPARDPDKVVEVETTPEQAHMYRLAGDYNPLHIDPAYPGVKGAGFTAPIMHGLCTLGHGARAVLMGMADNDAARFHALKLRFASPVIPGDTLVTKMWKLPVEEARKFRYATAQTSYSFCMRRAFRTFYLSSATLREPLPAGADRVVFTTEVKSTGKVVLGNAYMDLFSSPQSKL